MSFEFIPTIALIVKVVVWASLKIPVDLVVSSLSAPRKIYDAISLNLWDLALFTINLFTPSLPKGRVIKPGKPGYKGVWPTFVPPSQSDSRSPCPGLNALANHGILPHDGRRITVKSLQQALEDTWNFSPTLSRDSVGSAAKLFGHEVFDLSDFGVHNIIEHDGSLLRHDTFFAPNQGPPARDLIQKLLSSASRSPSADHPKGQITPGDLSRMVSVRLAQSKRDNPQFTISSLQKYFASSNAGLIYDIFGGDVAACGPLLLEERIPDGFEPFVRSRQGLTSLQTHIRSAEIALGFREITL